MVFNDYSKELGAFLRRKRIKCGYTQLDIAEEIGLCGPQYISNIERGVCNPSNQIFKYMIELYNIEKKEIDKIIMKKVEERTAHLYY